MFRWSEQISPSMEFWFRFTFQVWLTWFGPKTKLPPVCTSTSLIQAPILALDPVVARCKLIFRLNVYSLFFRIFDASNDKVPDELYVPSFRLQTAYYQVKELQECFCAVEAEQREDIMIGEPVVKKLKEVWSFPLLLSCYDHVIKAFCLFVKYVILGFGRINGLSHDYLQNRLTHDRNLSETKLSAWGFILERFT